MASTWYKGPDVAHKNARFIIDALAKVNLILPTDVIDAVFCETLLGKQGHWLVGTKNAFVFHDGMQGLNFRYSYDSILSVNIVTKFRSQLELTIAGAKNFIPYSSLKNTNIQGLYQYMQEKIDQQKNNKNNPSNSNTASDIDLERLYELMQKGIITEDEFNQKKKQILGL